MVINRKFQPQVSDGTHATSPARYFSYDMDLFKGDNLEAKLRAQMLLFISALTFFGIGKKKDDKEN